MKFFDSTKNIDKTRNGQKMHRALKWLKYFYYSAI